MSKGSPISPSLMAAKSAGASKASDRADRRADNAAVAVGEEGYQSYWLAEIVAPDGYELLAAPIEFTVTAATTAVGASAGPSATASGATCSVVRSSAGTRAPEAPSPGWKYGTARTRAPWRA